MKDLKKTMKQLPCSGEFYILACNTDASVWNMVYWLHRLDPSAGLRIAGPQLEFQTESRSVEHVELYAGWILIQSGGEVVAISMPNTSPISR